MSGDYPYDHRRKRWLRKKTGTRWSQYVTGRRNVQKRLLAEGKVTVSAYKTRKGDIFFTDPVLDKTKSGPGVLYRINVKWKGAFS